MSIRCPDVHPLLVDWYELTMVAGHLRQGRGADQAVFDLFFRRAPKDSTHAVAAGLDAALRWLEDFRFEEEDLDFLLAQKGFDDQDMEHFRDLRFTGDVDAVPEGTPVFPYEPMLRVRAPLAEAQVAETALLCLMNFETLIATKASRVVRAAGGDRVVDFGLRRAQGPDGGLRASRAAWLGGCHATSNALAGLRFGIPVTGTQAHSWVMSFGSELEAFRAWAHAFPELPIFLVDTYDTLKSGIPNAITVLDELRAKGMSPRAGIRLDSGDLAALSVEAARMLEAAGYEDPLIVGSGDLDEEGIAALRAQPCRINVWGVGTSLITAYDAPALPGVYKLAAVSSGGELRPCFKLSEEDAKATDPGLKEVVRYEDEDGRPVADVLHLEDEAPADGATLESVSARARDGTPAELRGPVRAHRLLQPVMRKGRRTAPAEPVQAARRRCRDHLARLPARVLRLRGADGFPVLLSEPLAALKRRLLASHRGRTT